MGCGAVPAPERRAEIVTKTQLIMEGITLSEGRASVQFHALCFQVWDTEGQVIGHEPSGPA